MVDKMKNSEKAILCGLLLIFSLLSLSIVPCEVNEIEGGTFPPYRIERNYTAYMPALIVISYGFEWKEFTPTLDWGIQWNYSSNPIFSILILFASIITLFFIINRTTRNKLGKIINTINRIDICFFIFIIVQYLFIIANIFYLHNYYYNSEHKRFIAVDYSPHFDEPILHTIIIILSIIVILISMGYLVYKLKQDRSND